MTAGPMARPFDGPVFLGQVESKALCRRTGATLRGCDRDTGTVLLSKRVSGFLIAFGVWSLWIWPTFLRNIWKDNRSFDHGPTAFFLIHLALVIVSLALGLIIGWIGVRGWRAANQALTSGPRPR
jgi:hypothetical protein